MTEQCLDCMYCESTEYGVNGFLGETVFTCRICEDETENKEHCFRERTNE